MSADNGIYILKTIRAHKKDGIGWVKADPHPVYRVAHASAIDNFDWYQQNQSYNLGAYMKDVWGSSPVFEDSQEAVNYASHMEKELSILEYGICRIDTNYIFYGDF